MAIISANNRGKSNLCVTTPLWEQSAGDRNSRLKRTVMWRDFSCHDVTMISKSWTRPTGQNLCFTKHGIKEGSTDDRPMGLTQAPLVLYEASPRGSHKMAFIVAITEDARSAGYVYTTSSWALNEQRLSQPCCGWQIDSNGALASGLRESVNRKTESHYCICFL